MTAAVYIVGGPDDDGRSDLRYSLRSVAANAPDITEAWVVGDVPDWFAGTKIPTPPLAEKFSNQRQSLTWFANLPGTPEQVYVMNDDMWIIEPVAGQLPTCRNLNPASTWAQAEGKLNTWHRAVIATAEWMGQRLGTVPHIYECHTPLLFDTAKLRDLLNAYPADRPFAVGELYPGAGVGGEGEHCGNAKVKAADSLEAKLAHPMPYLSASPDTWAGAVGEYVRGLFTEPSRWER